MDSSRFYWPGNARRRCLVAGALRRVTISTGLGLLLLPAAVAQFFNMEDYFVFPPDSEWHYTGDGQPGSSTEDDFTWTVLPGTKDVGGGRQAGQILTTTDEGDDSREDDIDYWYYEPNGDLMFYGFFNGQADGGGSFPSQDIVLTDPIKVGGRNQMVGDVVTDTGSGSAIVIVPVLGQQTVTATVTSRVEFLEFIPVLDTGMGPFHNVLRMRVEFEGEATVNTPFGPVTEQVPVIAAQFMLAEGLGMIAHNQQADVNDAERQVADRIRIGGQEKQVPVLVAYPVQFEAENGRGDKGDGGTVPPTGTVTVATHMNLISYDIDATGLQSDIDQTNLIGFAARGAAGGSTLYTIPSAPRMVGTIEYDESQEYGIIAGLTRITIVADSGETYTGYVDRGTVLWQNSASNWNLYR